MVSTVVIIHPPCARPCVILGVMLDHEPEDIGFVPKEPQTIRETDKIAVDHPMTTGKSSVSTVFCGHEYKGEPVTQNLMSTVKLCSNQI